MAESKTYGAVEVPEGGGEFDEKNTYYLNESKFNWNRFFRAAVPIVIALALMGGIAYGMSHGFSHFYGPPKGSDDDDSTKRDTSWIKSDNFECSKNKKCVALELTGSCCPTNEGVMLGCCN